MWLSALVWPQQRDKHIVVRVVPLYNREFIQIVGKMLEQAKSMRSEKESA